MLDDIGELPFPGIAARPATPWEPYGILRNAARELRARHYDMAVILRFDYWWGALLAEQAGIPVRWGYDLPETARFLTHALPYQPGGMRWSKTWPWPMPWSARRPSRRPDCSSTGPPGSRRCAFR